MTHTFTQSGLGSTPFIVCSPGDPAAKVNTAFYCEHCGRMLKNRYFVKSAEGTVSVVGISCVEKTGDAGLIAGAKRQQKQRRSEARMALAEQARQQREDAERKEFGGKTLSELITEQEDGIRAIWHQAADHIPALPVSRVLMASRGSFGSNMVSNAAQVRAFTDNMVTIMRDIVAKHFAREKASNPEGAAHEQVEGLLALVHGYQTQVDAARDEIARLERLRRKA